MLPVLAMEGADEVLMAIAAHIAAFDREAARVIPQNLIERLIGQKAVNALTWEKAAEGYCEWLSKSSTLRGKTNEKYRTIACFFAERLGEETPVYSTTREKCACIRDSMVEAGKSATTITNYFVCIKGFLKWMKEQGVENTDAIAECFHVDLPQVRKKINAMYT